VRPLFRALAPKCGWYDLFLSKLPADRREHYRCRTCKAFFDTHGGDVVVRDGKSSSVFHDIYLPTFFRSAMLCVIQFAESISIDDVADVSQASFGGPSMTKSKKHNCYFHHLGYERQPYLRIFAHRPSLKEDRKILSQAMVKHHAQARKALHLLKTRAGTDMSKANKFLPWAMWFCEMCDLGPNDPSFWEKLTKSPPSWCHVNDSALGRLLELVAPFRPDYDAVVKAWNEMVDPGVYQRPQAPPKEGTIDRAEALFKQLNLDRALDRKFATRLPEEAYVWKPAGVYYNRPHQPPGTFSDLRGVRGQVAVGEARSIGKRSYAWFASHVLPDAAAIEYVPAGVANYFAFTDALHADAPPMFKWKGNISLYLYRGGSSRHRWGLPQDWIPVLGITKSPGEWAGGGHELVGKGAYFILAGAREQNPEGVGLGLFPEVVRGDLHEVRSVIERASNTRKMARLKDQEHLELAGVAFQAEQPEPNGERPASGCLRFRVTYKNGERVIVDLTHWQ